MNFTAAGISKRRYIFRIENHRSNHFCRDIGNVPRQYQKEKQIKIRNKTPAEIETFLYRSFFVSLSLTALKQCRLFLCPEKGRAVTLIHSAAQVTPLLQFGLILSLMPLNYVWDCGGILFILEKGKKKAAY